MILADVHSDFLVCRFVATKPELREYKAVYVLSDAENIGPSKLAQRHPSDGGFHGFVRPL